MSILDTESFIAFQPVNSSDDTFTTGNTTARNAVAANLRRRGFDVVIGAQASTSATGWAIRPDPVNPDRNALFFSNGGAQNSTVAAALRVKLPVVGSEAVVGGFSLFIPNEFVKAPASSTVAALRVVATAQADTTWSTVASLQSQIDNSEIFRITKDLQIRYGTDAAQSQKTLGTGRTYFIEYRISPTDIRVWIDDTLVLQKVRAMNVETIGFVYEYYSTVSGAETTLLGAPGRWAIGNWYNLIEDTVAPNVRLGPSTRIIGSRAGSDVVANFVRPGGYTANYQVAALDLVDSPVASLQSSTVGDQDVYGAANDTTTSSGTQIHAVVTKVLASNLESNPHTIRPLIRSSAGLESSVPKARQMRVMNAITTAQLNSIARRPTDGKIFAVGNGIACYTNANNGQGAWTAVSNDGGSIHFKTIVFRADGWGVIGQSDGKIRTIAPGSDTPSAAITVGANASECWSTLLLPTGRILIGVAAGGMLLGPTTAAGTPDVAGNWSKVTVTGLTGGVICGLAYAPSSSGLGTGNGRVLASNDANPATSNRSDDYGATWAGTASGIGFTSGARGLVWDGSGFNVSTYTNNMTASYLKRSTDGITWNNPANTQAGTNTGNGQGPTWLGVADPDAQNINYMMGASGCIMVTINGTEWRPLSRVQTANIIRSGVKAANGDWLFVGDSGNLQMLTAGSIDGAMPALAGYQTYNNIAPANPSTGTAWTPSEAAASQFGMRLTS